MLFNILLVLSGWCLGAVSLAILVGKSVYRGNPFENSDYTKDGLLKQGLQREFADQSHNHADHEQPNVF